MSNDFEDMRVEPAEAIEPVTFGDEAPESEQPVAHDPLEASNAVEAEALGFESLMPTASASLPLHRSRFAPYTADEFGLFPDAEFAIEGVLPAQGVACVYGASQAGKSALLMSMVRSLTLGTEWFGRAVEPCRVWYVALEGAAGLRHRAEAIEKHFGEPLPKSAKFVFNDLRLSQPEDVAELAARIDKHGGAVVVIIDTLACAMAGADENSSRDMGLVVAGARALQRSTAGLVVLVHHTGKDATRGLRGHSSLLAALDATIEVKRHEDYRSWRLAKARDSEDGVQGAFVLDRVEIRLDSKGRPISSIVVIPTEMPEEETRPKAPVHKNQIAALACLTAQFEGLEVIEDVEVTGIDRTGAINAVKEVMDAGPRHRRLRAEEAIDGLIKGGFLIEADGLLSLRRDSAED